MATYEYDAFGNILEETGETDNPYRYAGYQYDEESGLYYLNSRMYDPEIARFMQEDTFKGYIADPLSLNLYSYCSNQPIKYYDPTGHWQKSDQTLSANAQAKIIKYTNEYFSATTSEGRKVAQAAANAVRNDNENRVNADNDSTTSKVYNEVYSRNESRKDSKGNAYVNADEWFVVTKSTKTANQSRKTSESELIEIVDEILKEVDDFYMNKNKASDDVVGY